MSDCVFSNKTSSHETLIDLDGLAPIRHFHTGGAGWGTRILRLDFDEEEEKRVPRWFYLKEADPAGLAGQLHGNADRTCGVPLA